MTSFDPIDRDLRRLKPADSLMHEELGPRAGDRIVGGVLAARRPRRRWQGLAVAAVAALAIGGVSAGTWALSGSGEPNAPAQQPANQPTSAPTPAQQPTDEPQEPVEQTPREVGELNPNVSAAAIDAIPDGKVLYVQCVSTQQGEETVRREYIDSAGWQWVWQTESTGTPFYLIIDPTEYLKYRDALAADPDGLMEALRSGTSGNSANGRGFSAVSELLGTEMVGPDLAAALVDALRSFPTEEGRTFTVTDIEVDGVPATRVTMTTQPGAPDLSGKGERVEGLSITMVIGTDGRLLEASTGYGEDAEEQATYESSCRRVLVDEIDPHVAEVLGTDREAKEVS